MVALIAYFAFGKQFTTAKLVFRLLFIVTMEQQEICLIDLYGELTELS